MSNPLNRFETVTFTHWKGLTKENHLGSIWQLAPQKASNIMVQLLAFKRGKTLNTFLSQYPTKTFADDSEYTWDVIGSNRRNIPLLEARDENGTVISIDTTTPGDEDTMVGANTVPFYLVFKEDWFADQETIFGNDRNYQFKILGDPRFEGTNAVYKVEMFGDQGLGCPKKRLQAGEKFSIIAYFNEFELSRKGGDIRFAAPVQMRNEWSSIRIQHKVPGSMLGKKLAVGIPVVKGTTESGKLQHDTINMWMHYVDYELQVQFEDYMNNALMYGKSTRGANGEYLTIGKSGNVVKTGDGLLEQLERANTQYYNDFSLKLIEDILYNLSSAKLDFSERTFLLKTGERGAAQFHKAILNQVSGWQAFAVNAQNPATIQKVSSQLHQNALSAGFQFVQYMAPNGIVIKVDVDPWYDDPINNKEIDPQGGLKSSYRYDFFYVGTADAPNIFKCAVEGQSEITGYQWGMRNPFTGQLGNPYMSFDEDSAVIHKMSGKFGVCVLDPTKTFSLIKL